MSSFSKFELKLTDFPSLYQSADRTSVESQRTYLRLTKADLVVLILGAAVASITTQTASINQALLATSAVFISCGTILTIFLSQTRHKRKWYGGRAAAESIKTLTWRYMMRAEPFEEASSSKGTDERFLSSLSDVKLTGDTLSLDEELGTLGNITPQMREVRNLKFEDRKNLYLDSRIQDQIRWYAAKAASNSRDQSTWFVLVGAAQTLGVAAAILLILAHESWINPTGVLATIAASALAWLQTRQHEELSQSYTVAAQELGLIADLAPHVQESEFSTYVADAETAISREHTLWLARRDQILALSAQN